jgi:hypothetical protein
MRRPDKTELEFGILLFLVLVGWGYFALRAALGFVGI